MAFSRPVEQYVRSPQPTLPESQIRYLQDELRKLEIALQSTREALIELEARVTVVETP
jgi:hypothetical protein